MSKPGPTQEEYESLRYKLASLETELGQARKLLGAQTKAGWRRRLWGMGTKAAVVVILVVVIGAGAASGGYKFYAGNDWVKFNNFTRLVYIDGFMSGVAGWRVMMQHNPQAAEAVLQCMEAWPPSQAAAVVDKFLKDNPQEMDKPLDALVLMAWHDACQKRGHPQPR